GDAEPGRVVDRVGGAGVGGGAGGGRVGRVPERVVGPDAEVVGGAGRQPGDGVAGGVGDGDLHPPGGPVRGLFDVVPVRGVRHGRQVGPRQVDLGAGRRLGGQVGRGGGDGGR